MLAISNILGELVEEYLELARSGRRDCRIVVPGLTNRIGSEIHDYLRSKGVNSYHVVGKNVPPDETRKWIRPIGLTSKRIGSFVAVVSPGQLARIQDSIRGSGGTIRSLAYSEEWPWIDNGSEAFRFDGPVLDQLVRRWTDVEEMQGWLRDFVLNGLVKYTRAGSSRTRLLLEEILGTFDPALHKDLGDVRLRLLFHAGVPRPSAEISKVAALVRSCSKLFRGIIDKCQGQEDARQQARDMVPDIVPSETERFRILESLDVFLDGLGTSSTLNLGLLAFHDCWGGDRTDATHWVRLDHGLLGDLFGVREVPRAEVKHDIRCSRGICSPNMKNVATFAGETVSIIITYTIPSEKWEPDAWQLLVLNRRKRLASELLDTPQGTVTFEVGTPGDIGDYSRRVPLKLALAHGEEVSAEERIGLHMCGEERPAFVVVYPRFDVVDPSHMDTEETPDKKFEIDEAVHFYLFNHGAGDVDVRDGDDDPVPTIEVDQPGIWRSAQRVDPAADASGQVIRVCRFGERTAVLCFEARDVEKGEFTLEDELRVQLTGVRSRRFGELADLWGGKHKEPYLYLGKLNDASRRRVVLAKMMEERIGWKPIVLDLLNLDHVASGAFGDYVCRLGSVEGEGFRNVSFSQEPLELLRAYSDARNSVYEDVHENVDSRSVRLEHPVYASHPIFVLGKARQTEKLLVEYLKCYSDILAYLYRQHRQLDWPALFILTHLDCAVHWTRGPLKNAFFLVGPWHPMVLAKRFMVQSALFARAQRQISGADGKSFQQLSALLRGVEGFRWLPGVSSDDRLLEAVHVSATSDPGWHLGLKTGIPALVAQTELRSLAGLCERLREILDIDSEIVPSGSDNLAESCLSSYVRAFPSRRTVGMRVRRGYSAAKIVTAVDRFLHDEEVQVPTTEGLQLPGGARLFFESGPGDLESVRWSNPPLHVYEYKTDAECHEEENPDIYMLAPQQALSFRTGDEKYTLPRGKGLEAVFHEPLGWVTEGESMVPKSVTYEFDVETSQNRGGESLGEIFTATATRVGKLFDDPTSLVRSIDLPERLQSPWAIIPGGGLDPAVLVKYVRDGMARSIQERALWDYRVDIAGAQDSFYILSTIPKGFSQAVNGVFGREDAASEFIAELGRIGIAIGGEALKSGRHALGVIGVVGAVRLLHGIGGNGASPLGRDERSVGFLVPVDSFASFFGAKGRGAGSDSRRADLLAVRLVLPGSPGSEMKICAAGIESKYVSGAFGQGMAHVAMEQAQATLSQIRSLVKASLEHGAMPERLGLLALLRFGLRISSPSIPREIAEWVEIERQVFEAVLHGEYEFSEAKHEAVLVTTEAEFPGVPEVNEIETGLWIRLNRDHWPGVSDSPHLDAIRTRLASLFVDLRPPRISEEDETASPQDLDEQAEDEEPEEPVPAGEPEPAAEQDQEPDGEDSGLAEEVERTHPLRRILIGADVRRRPVYFDPQSPVDRLDNLNMMVTGSSGKGKTQFLKYLICRLREQDKSVLILDLKNDFASDPVFRERARLTTAYVTFDGLPYNPMIPYPVQHSGTGEWFILCGQHIAGLAGVLKTTFRLGDQQEAAVKKAMAATFESAGIRSTGQTRYDEATEFPDFSNVGERLEHDNPRAYNRLDPLFTLELFRRDYRNASFRALVERSTILDLSQIVSDQIKNALAQMVVLSAHAYFNTLPHSGTIRQVLVFDEGHRVLSSDYMLSLVRECRAYGVSTVLSSQYPKDFKQEISASMATKIVHGNGASSDSVRAIVQLLGYKGEDGDVSRLGMFEAFVDNKHYQSTLVRTLNYPLYLVWSRLQELGEATRDELSRIDGVDTDKLPIGDLVRQLERLGLAEERDARVHLIDEDGE